MPKVMRVPRDHRALMVPLEQQDRLEPLDLKEPQVLLEQQDPPEQQEQQDRSEPLALKAPLGHKDHKDLLVYKEPLAQVPQVLLAYKDHRDHRDHKAI